MIEMIMEAKRVFSSSSIDLLTTANRETCALLQEGYFSQSHSRPPDFQMTPPSGSKK